MQDAWLTATHSVCHPCAVCSNGYGGNNGTCTPCEAGFFAAGASFNTPCALCPVNTAAPAAGSTACVACPTNSFSTADHTDCGRCPCDRGGPLACAMCAHGIVLPFTSLATHCLAFPVCDDGYGGGNNGTGCFICQTGQFAQGAWRNTPCRTCGHNQVSGQGSAHCADCPANSRPNVNQSACGGSCSSQPQ